jgi:hypothetical protein
MKISSFVCLALLARLMPSSVALFEEETGLNDFMISTTGHLVPTFTHATDSSILTSDSTSCTIACRSLESGKLQWRRQICKGDGTAKGLIAANNDLFASVDEQGIVRVWTRDSGTLLWDTPPHEPLLTGIWFLKTTTHTFLAATNGPTLWLYNAVSGRELGRLEAQGDQVWLLAFMSAEDSLAVLAGAINQNGFANSLVVRPLTITTDKEVEIGEASHLNPASVLASSLQVYHDQQPYAVGLTDNGKISYLSLSTSNPTNEVKALDHPMWTSVESVKIIGDKVLRAVGKDNRYSPAKQTVALFRYNDKNDWEQLHGGNPETQFEGAAYCSASHLLLAASKETLFALDTSSKKNLIKAVGGLIIPQDIASMDIVSCKAKSTSILIASARLTTQLITLTYKNNAAEADVVWATEDGLSTATAAILLDLHEHLVLTEEEEHEALNKLSFIPRLQSQVTSALSALSGLTTTESRNDNFGFAKVAVLLSNTVNRIWAIGTSGQEKGCISWSLDLPPLADKHILVHGTASSSAVIHGISGGTHSPDVLVLSPGKEVVDWKCIDGTTGSVHSSGSGKLASPVAQIVPLFGDATCRQISVIIHQDHTVSVVPDDEKSKLVVAKYLEKTENGFFSHIADREKSSLESLTLSGSRGGLLVQRVGQATFVGEEIIQVAYPRRDEIVQSPCNVLGDDSILLKYLNPHLAVIVTMKKADGDKTDPLVAALIEKKAPAKRKPLGATQPGDPVVPASVEDEPNLFINVVDTVTGHVLHRVSHANFAAGKAVPTLIVENWIVYAFFNDKTRRSELGVLTLYEGMIDKAGLTAFKSPEQVLSFSSMESRESKPVVLSKTYAVVKPITALGVTETRAGISTRQVLIASADDRLTAISRTLLEPRRPNGQVKETEKEEGLFQYSPLVPLVSLMSPSYNQTVHHVTSIISAPTALESQSLVLAFGGPDVFFARVSPSKGFDLLPESFNKPLLSIVVIGLVVVLFIVRRMGTKKLVKDGWS